MSIGLCFRVFTHGQLYVALGRETKQSDIPALIIAESVSLLDPSVTLTTTTVHRVTSDFIKGRLVFFIYTLTIMSSPRHTSNRIFSRR